MANRDRQVKIGAILSYVSIAFNILAGLIYTPWMINQIGQSEYGLYTLANSLITLFLIDFGLSSAVSRYIAKYNAEGDEQKVNNFLGVIYKLYVIIDAIIFIALVVVYFLIDTIYVKLNPIELEQFKVVYIIAALFALINFPFITFNGILNAYERFIPLKLADLINRFLVIVLTVIALSLGFGLYALVTVNAVAGLIIIIFKFIFIKKDTPIKVNFKHRDKALYKDIFGFSVWVTVASLAQRLIFNITPSILGIVANSAAIAVFGVVVTIEGYVYTITSAINGMFMPQVARLYAENDTEPNITPLLMKVGKFQYALNGLIVAGFAVLGQAFISLWMGEAYIDAYYGILLTVIPGLFYNSLQIANTAMVVTNRVKLQAFVNVGMGIVNVVCSFILSYCFGVVGACVSIFIAYMLRAIANNIIYYKVMRLDIPTFAKQCYFRMSIPILLTVALGIGLNYLLPYSGWLFFAIKGCIIVIVYLVLTLFIGLRKDDRRQLFSFIKNRKQKTIEKTEETENGTIGTAN